MKKKLISASEINEFLDCEMKWYYDYYLGLRPTKVSDALQVGTKVHENLPIIKTLSESEIYEDNLNALRTEITNIDKKIDVEKAEKALASKFGNIAGLTYLLKQIEDKFDDCEFEIEMRTKIRNPYSKHGTSRSFILGGKIDALPKGMKLFELKTLTYKGWKKMSVKLNWDVQAFIYSILTGRRIVDFIFLKKTTLKPSKKEDAIGMYERIFNDFVDNKKERIVIETNYITDKMMSEFEKQLWAVTQRMRPILSGKLEPSRNLRSCAILSCPYIDRCIFGGLVDVVKKEELKQSEKLHEELRMEDWL